MEQEIVKKLINIVDFTNPDEIFGINNLTAKQLKQVEAVLIETYGFKRIEWLDQPRLCLGEDTEILQSHILLDENKNQYKDKIGYFYSFSFSPTIYDPSTIKTVKNGCTISPLIYDPETFQPMKKITLTFDPFNPSHTKYYISSLLDDLLLAPEEYTPKGYRSCLVRFTTS
jgi:hypothetical protein